MHLPLDETQELGEVSKSKQGRVRVAHDPGLDVGSLSVLLLDDEPAIGDLVALALDGVGSVEFLAGAPAVGDLVLDGIDLVILDYRMPRRDGIDVLREIRKSSSSLPVIFLTGFADAELAERAIEEGADLFLTKPFEPRDIREAVLSLAPGSYEVDPRHRDVAGSGGDPVEEAATLSSHVGDRRFEAVIGEGEYVEGAIHHFGYRSVTVEFREEPKLVPGEAVDRIRFGFGDQLLQCDGGTVEGVSRFSAGSVLAEIRLPESWDVRLKEDGQAASASELSPGDRLDDRAEEIRSLPAAFRLATYELMDALESVRSASREAERRIATDSAEALREAGASLNQLIEQHGPLFWDAVQRFERAAREIEGAALEDVARRYVRRILFPFTLGSPFLARVVERPIGVPGDYQMLGKILGDRFEGYSLYDRVVNAWILSCGAASAYRHRVDVLHREILEATRVANAEGRRAKVLSMASGVAYEVQRFVSDPAKGREVDFSLVDFSEETLEEARRQYAAIGPCPEGVTISLHQSSVIDLANQSRGFGSESEEGGGFVPRNDYDLVYCAGLFDYLSDRLIRKVTAYLFGLLRPGGKLVISNFTTRNPIRSWMTYVMDWELIYRSETDFSKLIRESVGPEIEMESETDADGVETYISLTG